MPFLMALAAVERLVPICPKPSVLFTVFSRPTLLPAEMGGTKFDEELSLPIAYGRVAESATPSRNNDRSAKLLSKVVMMVYLW